MQFWTFRDRNSYTFHIDTVSIQPKLSPNGKITSMLYFGSRQRRCEQKSNWKSSGVHSTKECHNVTTRKKNTNQVSNIFVYLSMDSPDIICGGKARNNWDKFAATSVFSHGPVVPSDRLSIHLWLQFFLHCRMMASHPLAIGFFMTQVLSPSTGWFTLLMELDPESFYLFIYIFYFLLSPGSPFMGVLN